MAGFLGLFDYEKEGPGVAKNGPKKKTFVLFFEAFFRNFWKFAVTNLVFSLLSLPLLTNGLAACGITNVTRNIARDKHSFGLSDFFDTVKKNWKQGLIVGILNLLAYGIMIFDAVFFYNQKGAFGTVGLGISLCMLFVFTVMNFYIWTLMITFKFTIKQIYKNSFKFVFINLKKNILCLLILGLFYAVTVVTIIGFPLVPVVLAFILFYTAIFPAFCYLLIQFITFPVIKKFIIDPYYKEHPDEDLEKRANLGIEIEEDEEENEEPEQTEEEEEILD